MVAILSQEREVILGAVQAMYTAVATRPHGGFHFPVGRAACELVGYPAAELDPLPATAVESFAGVGYPFQARVIGPGDTVLDLGSGSGTDTLIASRLVGPSGRVFALDLTPAMREKLLAAADRLGARHVTVIAGNAEAIPLPDASVDVVTTNGVLNLVPDKDSAVREIARVLRPGGRLQLADIVLGREPSAACRARPELWAECIVGAVTRERYLGLLQAAGLTGIEVLEELDYFRASPSEETRKVAASLGAQAMVLRATLGDAASR
ncbi:MAG TPA: methyltransferase domain-containing protein [Gemmatimonadales bacterium]|jgi:SAM-dependent methyltransferase|nr:methyltransferase domain-containing protein [Gemmatimonadales bacterium]